MKILFFILTAFFALARSQQNPTVTMYPEFNQVFSGDTLVLTCSGSGQLKWFFNNLTKDQTRETWTINVISKDYSGSYHCERDGKKSDAINITVLDDLPVASLSIKSGRAVINRGDSVVLELHVDTGLLDWRCRVFKGGRVKKIGFNKTLMTSDKKDVQFHPNALADHESPAIFWCQHKTEAKRSNPITIKTTGRMVMLETPPEPAILGKQLTIWCRVWGEPDISNSFFLKNNKEKIDAINSSLTIQNVKIEDQGIYSCTATYKFKKNTSNIPNTVTSDPQELLVSSAQPPEAVLTKSGTSLKCSCPKCSKPHGYRWYKQKQGQMEIVNQEVIDFSPSEVGSYWCKAVWDDRVSAPSAQFSVKLVPSGHAPVMLIVILFVCVILMVSCCVIAVFYMKKRRSSAAFREDGGYEEVGQRKATDNIMMQEKKKEGEYEALKQSEKEGEYHTLGAEGGKGTEAGYEALKRSKMDEKEGEYHTLAAEGGKGAEGGYEALKRAKMDEKEGEYQTLGAEGGKGGEEILKKNND